MTVADADVNFNLYLVRQFLDAISCRKIIDELSVTPQSQATVYGVNDGASVDDRVRKTISLTPNLKTLENIVARLSETQDVIAANFGINVQRFEAPQFLRYTVGDFFVAHQDGNTGMLLNEREQFRKVSIVIFLNNEVESPMAHCFSGGSLVFTEWRAGRKRGRYRLTPEVGMLVAFPSDTTHEVTPITWGERYSIVSWYG